jgi:hypothetical protein
VADKTTGATSTAPLLETEPTVEKPLTVLQ